MKLQRIREIQEHLKKHGAVSLDDLCQRFAVSKNTIRRDINELEARQIIRKVYGGVVLNDEETTIPSIAQREITMHAEKVRIAKKAAEFVNDGDIVVIDSGSTVVHTIEHLTGKQYLTLITNSVPALNATLAYDQFHVIATGGDLYHPTDSFIGLDAIAMLKKLNANTLFLAATGISLTKGVTNSSTIESEIKKAMIQVSEQIILLVDHTKFDVVSLMTFAELNDIDILVTDMLPPQEYCQYFETHNVKLVIADE